MSLTPTQVGLDHVYGDRRVKRYTVLFDNSYLAGGMPLVAADFGLKSISHIECDLAVKSDGSAAFATGYDYTNGKLQAFKANGTTNLLEVAAGVDLSTYTARVLVHGY